MKILYIGTLCTNETIKKYISKCKKRKPTLAGIIFDQNITKGLSDYVDIEAVSIIPVPSYPDYNGIFVKAKSESYEKTKITYITFLNIPIIKYFFIIFNLLFYLIKWTYRNRNENKAILLSNINTFFLIPAIWIKKITNIKIFSIVTDLPEYEIKYSKNVSSIKIKLNKILIRIYKKYKENIDGFVFLSPYMNDIININRKPYTLVDGIVDVEKILKVKSEFIIKKRAILYAGGLNESYGIKKLIQAFLELDDKSIELWLYGSGDYQDKISIISKTNPNVKYGGQVSHEEIIIKEREASILINPRPTHEEYTKYSFPSKTLEYMLSGTPVLTTRLKCISKEYDNYLFFIDDETKNGIKNSIKNLFSSDSNKLQKKAEQAKQFIINNKNLKMQASKIIDLIKGELKK